MCSVCHQGALFESNHRDTNDLQTISYKCQVLTLTEYRAKLNCVLNKPSDNSISAAENNNNIHSCKSFLQEKHFEPSLEFPSATDGDDNTIAAANDIDLTCSNIAGDDVAEDVSTTTRSDESSILTLAENKPTLTADTPGQNEKVVDSESSYISGSYEFASKVACLDNVFYSSNSTKDVHTLQENTIREQSLTVNQAVQFEDLSLPIISNAVPDLDDTLMHYSVNALMESFTSPTPAPASTASCTEMSATSNSVTTCCVTSTVTPVHDLVQSSDCSSASSPLSYSSTCSEATTSTESDEDREAEFYYLAGTYDVVHQVLRMLPGVE